MNDVVRMRLAERLAGLEEVVDGLGDRHALLLAKHRGEVVSLQVLHRDEGSPVLEIAGVENTAHVLASQLVRGLRLTLKTLPRLGQLGEARQEKLERHTLVEMLVARGEDHPHPADADDPLDAVLAEEERPLRGDR